MRKKKCLAEVVWVHSSHGNLLIYTLAHVGLSDLFHMSDLAWPWHDQSECPALSAALFQSCLWVKGVKGGNRELFLYLKASNPN